jgi:protein-S-isoprenylcysteine O-methyltransferase Ste14
MRREEAVLSREFGDQYVRFKQEVAALCPFVY